MSNPWPLDLDAPIDDRLSFASLRGTVDYLDHELLLIDALPSVTVEFEARSEDRLDVHYVGPLAELLGLRFFSSVAVDLGEVSELAPGGAPPRVAESLRIGALSAYADRAIRFRVGEVGNDRWSLRDALISELGWINQPRDWAINLEVARGRLVAEMGQLHWSQRFGPLERIPASTTPLISAALVRLAKVEPDSVLIDPFCGAGTNLMSAYAMSDVAQLVGLDSNAAALARARSNAEATGAPIALVRADATAIPLPDGTADRVIANLPFGKRVGSHQGNMELYPRFLRELTRILTGKGRAVLLTEDKRLLVESIQRTQGLRVIKDVTFESGGAHPSAYVVVRSRGQARRRSR